MDRAVANIGTRGGVADEDAHGGVGEEPVSFNFIFCALLRLAARDNLHVLHVLFVDVTKGSFGSVVTKSSMGCVVLQQVHSIVKLALLMRRRNCRNCSDHNHRIQDFRAKFLQTGKFLRGNSPGAKSL